MGKTEILKADETTIVLKCRCNDEHTLTVNDKDQIELTTKEGTPDAPASTPKKTILRFNR